MDISSVNRENVHNQYQIDLITNLNSRNLYTQKILFTYVCHRIPKSHISFISINVY